MQIGYTDSGEFFSNIVRSAGRLINLRYRYGRYFFIICVISRRFHNRYISIFFSETVQQKKGGKEHQGKVCADFQLYVYGENKKRE